MYVLAGYGSIYLGSPRNADLYELEATLIYIVNSQLASAT